MSEKHLVRGVLAGVAGGLVASWVMNEFIAGPGKQLQESLQSDAERREEQAQISGTEGQEDDATMKAADAIVNTATGGRHLSHEGKEQGGPIVHYGFGALMGGVYGGLAEYSSLVRAGFGSAFASVLWAGADLVAVPALGFGPPPEAEKPSAHATHWAAHVVYGATTELVRRLVRVVL